jgi:hypothetical protein
MYAGGADLRFLDGNSHRLSRTAFVRHLHGSETRSVQSTEGKTDLLR